MIAFIETNFFLLDVHIIQPVENIKADKQCRENYNGDFVD